MTGRSRPQSRGSAPSTANTVVSLVMLIAASVSNAYAQTKSPTAAWIQVGSGTGPAKVSVVASNALGATVTMTRAARTNSAPCSITKVMGRGKRTCDATPGHGIAWK